MKLLAIWIMMRSNSRKCIQDDEKITIVYFPIWRILNGFLGWYGFFFAGYLIQAAIPA